ncbi:hypothetical protein BJF93_01505 [Xaviernesmea oryzae]|uniref:Uncharacterized protein n=1 Tax=Xaviernesmea oryzae TaxID=464029 RepID=A0A1Q9B2B8_9HYPH|nr:hypothetical protein [Xaviernesmea oryzae]OLP62148.1 hypothetical protein BJF93_01505 [Xaviernesmea oryzae]SEL89091.1 hypothetical protein SAMN04487976_114109 [Xaviernesmea oryzae]
MAAQHLIEDEMPPVQRCAARLAEHIASVHQETGEFGVLSILLKNVVVDGVAMGDYEVIVQQIRPADVLDLDVIA